MKLWIDDVRPAPEGYVWCKSVHIAQHAIEMSEYNVRWFSDQAYEMNIDGRFEFAERMSKAYRDNIIELIDIDHDAGDYASDGGDYICLLNWLEKTGRNYPIRIHSMNPVGIGNMRRVIERNGWKEVF